MRFWWEKGGGDDEKVKSEEKASSKEHRTLNHRIFNQRKCGTGRSTHARLLKIDFKLHSARFWGRRLELNRFWVITVN